MNSLKLDKTYNLTSLGFFRVGIVTPELKVANPDFNTQIIINAIKECNKLKCQLILFPELCITGYTCGDLFYQRLLLERAKENLFKIVKESYNIEAGIIVGLPLDLDGKIFNCAIFICKGEILGIIPKRFIPNTQEFYEQRWFAQDKETFIKKIEIDNKDIYFGRNILFQYNHIKNAIIGIEICEDLWSPIPPSTNLTLDGALIIANLSASNEILGKCEYRKLLISSQSAKCISAYLYASCGPCESSTDLVYSGHSIISENGKILEETERFDYYTQIIVADIDIEKLVNERIKNSTYRQSLPNESCKIIPFNVKHLEDNILYREISPTPFIPFSEKEKNNRCKEVFSIQTTALGTRLRAINCKKVVIGISGGLDSTLALLVCVKTFDKLNIPRENIIGITMPGLGTTKHTKTNAEKLAHLLKITLKTIPIIKAIKQHFKDIEHDKNKLDITYENAQARERTQILMDLANKYNAIVVGTGDLSELALGWCTFNGDHMSMYNVNAGVPKTLVQYLIKWCAENEFQGEISKILINIFNTPISPELLPPSSENNPQSTEEKIGPYLLHDFFLFYHIRHQFQPHKIFFLANLVFREKYKANKILDYLEIFYKRFFNNQFKRSSLPDGPKVGTVALSPRGDWRMPSDSDVSIWLEEINYIRKDINSNNKEQAKG